MKWNMDRNEYGMNAKTIFVHNYIGREVTFDLYVKISPAPGAYLRPVK